MALSNIFREPRREITESAIGIVCLGAGLAAIVAIDYGVARWLNRLCGFGPMHVGDFALWSVAIGLGGFFLGGLLYLAAHLTHEAGENVCDWFEDRGIHLRPRRRR
jgi:hypothetical protein